MKEKIHETELKLSKTQVPVHRVLESIYLILDT